MAGAADGCSPPIGARRRGLLRSKRPPVLLIFDISGQAPPKAFKYQNMSAITPNRIPPTLKTRMRMYFMNAGSPCFFRAAGAAFESVFDHKDVALQEARRLLEGRHQKGVKVIEETYDADTDNTRARVVFSRQKGEDKPRQKSRKESEEKS